MNEFYLPNICYNNRRDTQKLCYIYPRYNLHLDSYAKAKGVKL